MNSQMYSYAGGDPINHCDVTGRCVQDMQKLQPQNVESEPLDPVQTTTATNQGLIGQISNGLGNLLGNIPLVGGILKGAVNIAGGVLDSAVGAVTLGQLYNPSGGISQAVGGVGNVLGGALDLAGKAWAAPDTAIGLIAGISSLPFGGRVNFGHNAIVFSNVWFQQWTNGNNATTFGNTILTGSPFETNTNTGVLGLDAAIPSYYTQEVGYAQAAADRGFTQIIWGQHEEGHTYQAQLFGPFFFPAYFLNNPSNPFSSNNSFENAADDYGASRGTWFPHYPK